MAMNNQYLLTYVMTLVCSSGGTLQSLSLISFLKTSHAISVKLLLFLEPASL